MLYEIFDSLRLNARVVHVGEFPNREAAQAHGAELIGEKKPQMVRVRTGADQPRKSFDDLIADMGLVENLAIKKFQSKLAAEKRAVPRFFPPKSAVAAEAKKEGLDLVCADEEVSSPKLTDWYVREYCRLNNLKV